ncbi:mannose-1-phosphate guanylyltransferase/mannose-6-phosphate isomerase [Ferrovum sp. PN-J185]|uniref:mannose-1-phosphate guanylyltransferase/mannose-6-phosphate isomerase n=1 Tax=Ferrovum sp. PN-J185 TaxID=1356306 RepID=UPI000797FEFE|nr:mannose-1-phosphate guanylyltransferase/mannose-6-phosphate isomerase [Ferrovum sp. PN-J185]KXW55519.1 alginate biosynthesis protein AlgA [Ferrovum sp. PN-J185]MCC6067924.1 mannose-1-phosphate guanylyltransferase/mannose-6-phosphate isomerase [Ferrovum sp. PN-J185]MDE1891267.1 mannose-1-phosphate guanylyltransferase/mannose-6-phosphate isomerase [Betaproteobacteria bacterium]MDE2056307.1 mannose-1-phosphate guanylyltransferase/mannose-6-phosphate isomerase [Betaproteobacteria bacterium]
MASGTIQPVILCGGSGTRLWPLSRKAFPKQFVPLINNKSLLQLTFERVKQLNPSVLTVSSEEHRFLVDDAAQQAEVNAVHLLEPVARNTAAAILYAALYVKHDEDLLLFCPADHHIPDHLAFSKMISEAKHAAQAGYLVTFGVVPTEPSTAYGYIQASEEKVPHSTVNFVKGFIEKPNLTRAIELLSNPHCLWNAGIFLMRKDALIQACARYAPDILAAVNKAYLTQQTDQHFVRVSQAEYQTIPSHPIDTALFEKADNVAVMPFSGVWSDVGSWNALAQLTEPDNQGNRLEGQAHVLDSQNNYIYAQHRPVVALGVTDLIIVDTQDALLVTHKDQVEKVKQVVSHLQEAEVPEALQHRRVPRPWGEFDSVDRGERFQVKRITVKPGGRLSLQMHHHRAEHWVVVKGTATVTRDEDILTLSENQSIYIPLGIKHRLENLTTEPLEIIEVQSGGYLGEDDIVRFDDGYGRS